MTLWSPGPQGLIGLGRPAVLRGATPAQGVRYDPAASALFAAQSAAGWTPTAAYKRAADALITGLNALGIWAGTDMLHVPIAGNAGAAYPNWKSPGTFDIIPVYTDRPIVVPFRGISSNGTNSNFRTGYTPSVHGSALKKDDAAIAVYISAATPGTNAVREMGAAGTASLSLIVRNTSNLMQGVLNDANATSSSTTHTNASGSMIAERVNSSTKRFWVRGAQLGTDLTRSSTALADAEMYYCGQSSSTFNTRQHQAFWVGSYSCIAGKEAAFTTLMDAFMAAVVPAPTRGVFWTAGDSYTNGSGGTTNVGMSSLLNYWTGQTLTNVAAGGTTLAQQATAILAQSGLWNTTLFWWDGSGNGSGGATADLATVQSVIDGGMSVSRMLMLSDIVIGPPNPGVTDVLLADRQTYRAGLLAKGITCPDVQGFLVGISPSGTSKSAGLVDLSLFQGDGVHMLATTADQVTAWILPTLNAMP